jgi:hypothetical protein
LPLLKHQTGTQLSVDRECEREALNFYTRFGASVLPTAYTLATNAKSDDNTYKPAFVNQFSSKKRQPSKTYKIYPLKKRVPSKVVQKPTVKPPPPTKVPASAEKISAEKKNGTASGSC